MNNAILIEKRKEKKISNILDPDKVQS